MLSVVRLNVVILKVVEPRDQKVSKRKEFHFPASQDFTIKLFTVVINPEA
jgi:hypothetical protein